MTRHIQNPATGHYSALFGYTHNLVQCLHMQKPGTLEIWEYLEPFHLHPDAYSGPSHIYKNLQILRTLTYLKTDIYSEPSQKFKIMFFAIIVKLYFSKALHLRFLTVFWIRLFLNKHLTLCIVWYIFRTLPIIAYSGLFTASSDIFRHTVTYLELCATLAYSEPCHVQNSDIFGTKTIFRTLPRHILAHSERCVTLAYSEHCHIRKFVVFRILA